MRCEPGRPWGWGETTRGPRRPARNSQHSAKQGLQPRKKRQQRCGKDESGPGLAQREDVYMHSALVLTSLPVSRARLLQGAGALCGLPFACELYARAPPRWSSDELPKAFEAVTADVKELVVLLPGAGGPDANTRRIVAALGGRGVQVVEYDYRRFAGDTLRAPFNSQRVGETLGEELARVQSAGGLPRLEVLHLIGVSVGAFAADRCAGVYAARVPASGRARTRLTLLDPFTARGLGGLARASSAYGVARFGSSADEAWAIFNADDPVPSTNSPLRLCSNLDVTAAEARASFEPLPGDSLHSWPCAWFGLLGGQIPAGAAQTRRGDVFVVS